MSKEPVAPVQLNMATMIEICTHTRDPVALQVNWKVSLKIWRQTHPPVMDQFRRQTGHFFGSLTCETLDAMVV